MNLFELFVKIGADTSQAEKGMKNTQGVSETLTNKIKVMSAQFEAAQKNVDKLTQEFNESVNKAGATDKATQELAKKLADAEKEAGQFAKKLDEVQKEAEQSEKALDDCNEEIEDTGKKAEKSGNGLANFAGKLGKELATAAKIGAAAIGAASAAIVGLTTKAANSFAEYEQLAGGAQKIFNDMDFSRIATDANNAYKELGLSANQYLAVINDVGATFAATMGDEAGYNTARQGLQAISDYASGTGKNVDLLSQKFMMITRSSASYQSIADQFSGILPATSAAFLEQAQSVGVLDEKYTKLTEVPIDEYQAAVSAMLEQGVKDLGLYENTVAEAETTVSGSINAMKASWENLITAFGDENANVDEYMDVFIETVQNVVDNIVPVIFTAIPNILKAGVTLIQNLANGILNNQGAVSDGTVQTIDMLLDTIMSLLPSIIAAGITIVAQLVIGLIRSIPRIIEVAPELIDALTVGLKMVYNRLIASGAEIVGKIKEGISNAWAGLVSWFSNIWDSLFGNRSVNVNVNYGGGGGINGSHAGGLSYVPYDGYIAQLHKGERILTAEEARGYNNGTTGGVNVVQNIYSQAKTAADLMQEAIYQQERAVFLGV